MGTLRDFARGLLWHGATTHWEAAQARISDALPSSVRGIRHQWLGHMSSGCTATQGLHEGCDFSCTACYLATTANKTPPLPLAEAKAQLEEIARFAGKGGNVQLTAGEVTLLPVEHLSALVRHCRELGLDPMVMTHGQTFERDPAYLDTLLAAGLEKISVHVDCTQRGRDGMDKNSDERAHMEVRERMAEVIRSARRRTGRTLHAAHTVTVTPDNLEVVPEIVRWTLKNADAFRMLSFQPTAAVGRTRADTMAAEPVWDGIEVGAGRSLNSHTFSLGHPDCNHVCLTFVVRFGDEVQLVEVRRTDKEIDARFFDSLLGGRFRGFHTDGADGAELLGRCLGLLAREPRYMLEWPLYGVYRAISHLSWAPRFFAAVARGEAWFIRPFVFVIHQFMSEEEMATELGQERLDACGFRVPVEGKMVSMCELNGTELRAQRNRAQTERLISLGERPPRL